MAALARDRPGGPPGSRAEIWQALVGRFVEAADGSGRAVLVAGLPGMGKMALVRRLQTYAVDAGATVLSAAGSATERSVPMGVIRQLFAGAGLAPGQADRLARALGTPDAPAEMYRQACLLAENAPLVMTVDDIHEADPESVRCLLSVVRRLGPARLLLVLGEQAAGAAPSAVFSAELVRNPRCTLLSLEPLSAEETAEALDARGPGFTAASTRWRQASGGNPLLLNALLDDHAASLEPIAGPAFRRAAQYIVGALGEEAAQTARGLALLGPHANPGRINGIVELPAGSAERYIGTLTAVGLVEQHRFRLPAAGVALLSAMTPHSCAALHRRAARILFDEGVAIGAVAPHIVAGGTARESWCRGVLRESARAALRRDDAEWAVSCLRLALDACGEEAESVAVRIELARAEWELDPLAIQRHGVALMSRHRAGLLDAAQRMSLVGQLLWHGGIEEADEVLVSLDEEEAGLSAADRAQLEIVRLWYAFVFPLAGARYGRRAEPAAGARVGLDRMPRAIDPNAEGALLLGAVLDRGSEREQSPEELFEAAERLLESIFDRPSIAPVVAAIAAFVQGGRLDRVAAWCDRLVQGSGRRTPTVRAVFAALVASAESRLGNFELARCRADEALALLPPAGWGVGLGVPLSAKAVACTALGRHEEAAECFRLPVPKSMFQALPGLQYLEARGRHHLALKHFHAAVGDFHACRDLMQDWALDAAPVSWRVHAAEALLELDSPMEAAELLVGELESNHGGNPWLRDRSLVVLERTGFQGQGEDGCAPEEPRADEDPLAGLSKTELRVARLAAFGCTNRQVSAQLFVTTSTVEQHLTHIYKKLGIRSRNELADLFGGAAEDVTVDF